MGRSQRRMLLTQNTTSAGEIIAQGAIAPGQLLLAGAPPEEGLRTVEDIAVPIGEPGGPLSGSSLTGAVPDDLNVNPPPLPVPTPVLTSLDPATAELNSADFTLRCLGSGYTDMSVIMFAGQPEPIVFVSTEEITTVVKPSLPWGAVTLPVTVKAPDGQESAPLDFTFTEGAPAGTARKTKAKGA